MIICYTTAEQQQWRDNLGPIHRRQTKSPYEGTVYSGEDGWLVRRGRLCLVEVLFD